MDRPPVPGRSGVFSEFEPGEFFVLRAAVCPIELLQAEPTHGDDDARLRRRDGGFRGVKALHDRVDMQKESRHRRAYLSTVSAPPFMSMVGPTIVIMAPFPFWI